MFAVRGLRLGVRDRVPGGGAGRRSRHGRYGVRVAHNFGAHYHTPHGWANAIVLPWVLEYSKPVISHRLADLARVSGLANGSESDAVLADRFIAHVRALKAAFGIPEGLQDLREADIPAIAQAALAEAHLSYAVPRYMDQATCEGLIRQMRM